MGFEPVERRNLPRFMVRFSSFLRASIGLIGAIAVAAPVLAQNTAAEQEADAVPFDPDAPMQDLPGMNVAWPKMSDTLQFTDNRLRNLLLNRENLFTDERLAAFFNKHLSELAGAKPAEPPRTDILVADVGVDTRYSVAIGGIDALSGEGIDIRPRFDALSVLLAEEDGAANLAQIQRRAMEDQALLERLLDIEGYADARVFFTLEPVAANQIAVQFTVEPGARYRLNAVTLEPLETADPADVPMFQETFGVRTGDAIDQDDIEAGRTALAIKAGEIGYPFASVGVPQLIIDHARSAGLLTVPGELGGRYNFGQIVIKSGDIFGADHVERISRFEPGELYDVRNVEDLRQALIATGLISRVTIEPVKSATNPGQVDIALDIVPAPMRTIAGEIGYDTSQGFRAEVSWEHRNFFPPEGALKLRGVVGTQEQLAGITFRRNNWRGRDRVLTINTLASNTSRDAYDAKTVQLGVNFERKTTLIFQKRWTWYAGAEILYSDERGVLDNLTVDRQTYYIAAAPVGLFYDGTNDLLDPTAGFRLGARLSPEISLQGGSSLYTRMQLDGSAYFPATNSLVLAGRVRFGSIVGGGTGVDAIAPSRRSYAGGGGSVRGYGYQRIGPLYASGDPIGGRGLFEASLEGRYRFGVFGVVPFIDIGTVNSGPMPTFDDIRIGAGIGARYYSSFGPIRIDIATPLNRREGDGWIQVYVSLGQAF